MEKPMEEQIRTRAHELWEQAGKPDGREDEFWHAAEKAIKHETGDLIPNFRRLDSSRPLRCLTEATASC